jgi:7,8-dihydroneopterin aldolase/epimerase/oxygenase
MAEVPVPGADCYTVVVRNLVLMVSIGVRRGERDRLQRVRISVELIATPDASYPREDRRRVINYEKIVTAIRQIARSGHIDLCEGFAERIVTVCFADPRVAHARVSVEKIDIYPDAEAVGAILERSRPA